MRLAFLTHEPLHPPSGGGSAELGYLVREAVRRGHEAHVVGPAIENLPAVEREFGAKVHEFRAWKMGRYTSFRNFKYTLYPFLLERLAAQVHGQMRFDAFVSQHAISAVAAGRLKRKLGLPVVMNFLDHLTGFMETWPPWLMPPPALSVLKRYELSLPRRARADGVLTVSDVLADLFVTRGYPRHQIQPIYYGYDADLFQLNEAALEHRSDSPPTIVMHGSLDHHHLGRIALEAVAHVTATRPDAIFKFLGHRTPALARFQAMAQRRGLGASVRTIGFVPYHEVGRELASATVGIVPYEESTGVHCAFVAKVVEYLAVGLPVACTPLMGIKRYFAGERLVRFSSFDGRDLGRCILDWLGESRGARAELARSASARVRAELDWHMIGRRALAFVEAIVERAGGIPGGSLSQ